MSTPLPASGDRVYTEPELLALLDSLFDRGPDWWARFYEDRAKPCPFFVDAPDESLDDWLARRPERGGRALDIGCGHGRNAIHLARHGYDVDGVDFSRTALDWAAERAAAAGVTVRWHAVSIFDHPVPPATYDLVYDAGCFHHLPPHRRRSCVERVASLLKPGGWFGLTCFRPEGGSGYTDREIYERRALGGGIGYGEEELRAIWSHALEVTEVRTMRELPPGGPLFGRSFLSVLWARRTLRGGRNDPALAFNDPRGCAKI